MEAVIKAEITLPTDYGRCKGSSRNTDNFVKEEVCGTKAPGRCRTPE